MTDLGAALRRAGRRAKMVAAMDRVEREISPSGYLVGDSFTVAELTAAALLYGVARPPQFQYPLVAVDDLPESWREFNDSLAQRPGGQWVAQMYLGTAGSLPNSPPLTYTRRSDLTPGTATRPVRQHDAI